MCLFVQVSVPCSSLFDIVTVRCGHCSNLWSVNMAAAAFQSLSWQHLVHQVLHIHIYMNHDIAIYISWLIITLLSYSQDLFFLFITLFSGGPIYVSLSIIFILVLKKRNRKKNVFYKREQIIHTPFIFTSFRPSY